MPPAAADENDGGGGRIVAPEKNCCSAFCCASPLSMSVPRAPPGAFDVVAMSGEGRFMPSCNVCWSAAIEPDDAFGGTEVTAGLFGLGWKGFEALYGSKTRRPWDLAIGTCPCLSPFPSLFPYLYL